MASHGSLGVHRHGVVLVHGRPRQPPPEPGGDGEEGAVDRSRQPEEVDQGVGRGLDPEEGGAGGAASPPEDAAAATSATTASKLRVGGMEEEGGTDPDPALRPIPKNGRGKEGEPAREGAGPRARSRPSERRRRALGLVIVRRSCMY